MGIPGILKEIGKGERVALSKLAIEFFERNNRPLRIAIDAAIWNFQTQSGQGGKNPALRTLFFRLLKLLALPIQPVFVYDGKNKPLTKRGRTVNRYNGTCIPNELSKVLVQRFCYPWHVAPGEAEAECALLQRKGVVDMVMSQDADAIMFGAGVTLRDWSKEGTRGNKTPSHVNVMDAIKLKEISGLDSDGMVLVALLSGGDYDEAGVPGFGAALACEIARAGFGRDMVELVRREDWLGLREWRERLQHELESNESGYFRRRHKTLKVPATFPDLKILGYYLKPAVSEDTDLPAHEVKWTKIWESEIDVPALRSYTAGMFDWRWRSGACRFVRCFAQPHFQHRLRCGAINPASFTTHNITERRKHFINDGIPELRLGAVPAEVVGIDIEAEEENPEYTSEHDEEQDEDLLAEPRRTLTGDGIEDAAFAPVSPSKKRRPVTWDPYVMEKWWIPETLLQLGLPEVVEDWHQLQRDIQADPQKFAVKKSAKLAKGVKQIDTGMKQGALREFFTQVNKHAKLQESYGTGPLQVIPGYNHLPSDEKVLKIIYPQTGATSIPSSINGSCKKQAVSYQKTKAGSEATNTIEKWSSEGRKAENTDQTKECSSSFREHALVSKLSGHSYSALPEVSEDTTRSCQVRKSSSEVIDIAADSRSNILSTGDSFSSAITIESSPNAAAASPPSSNTKLIPIPSQTKQIAQRRTRRAKTPSNRETSCSIASPTRPRRPIESFFIPSREQLPLATVVGPEIQTVRPDELQLASEPAGRTARGRRNAALARESLPGTWKDVDCNSVLSSDGLRVSYVDMTGD